jgi:glutamate formiminotransferase
VGARPILVAYNLWLSAIDIARARSIATELRRPSVRALAFELGSEVQVSLNLVDPFNTGPAVIYDEVAGIARASGGDIDHAELVGLVPLRVLESIPAQRREEIGLDEAHTIEALLESL